MAVVLTDFGLAKATATGTRYTRTGQALGTPGYMSPEAARGETHALTAATDVWSLGCVLFALVAGRAAFEGETPAAVVGQVLVAEPPRLRALDPGVPEAVERVVRTCLAKRPRHRYADAAPLRDDLDRCLAGRLPARRPPGGARRAALVGVAAMALAATGLVFAARRAAPPPTAAPPAAAEALAAHALAARRTDPRAAARELTDALEGAPGRHAWRVELGLIRWGLGDAAAARAAWDAVPGDTPEAPWARLYTALAALFAFDRPGFDPAPVEAGLGALAGDPGRVGQLARAARSALRSDWVAARAALPRDPGWLRDILRAWVEHLDPAGDRVAAVQAYDRALAEGPPLGWAHAQRANLLLGLGDRPRAADDYRRALDLNPDLGLARVNLAEMHLVDGDPGGAITECDRALARDPALADGYRVRAAARLARGDGPGAREDLDQALRVRPEHVGALLARAGSCVEAGDGAAARADVARALAVDPTSALAHYWDGTLHLLAAAHQPACAAFTQAIGFAPGLVEAWVNRGIAREGLDDVGGALADYDRAVDLDERHVNARLNRARLRTDRQEFAGAIADLTRVLEVVPGHLSALARRADTRLLAGDRRGAREDYAAALAAAPQGWPFRSAVEARLAEFGSGE